MFKKLFIMLVVGAIMAISIIPMWTAKMAEDAFKNPERQISPENVKQAIQTRMYVYMYRDARKLAEKAVLYFPESKNLPYFIYTAAMSSEKSNAHLAAIHWYGYFIDLFPDHEWIAPVKNNYNKLKTTYVPKAEPTQKK
jgi:hypothetical protein